MRNLFSSTALLRLREFCTGGAGAAGLVCAFDFDGTLAPIVSEPRAAYMTREVEDALRALVPLTQVVVLSGRSVDDLRERIPVEGVLLAGSHGSESPFVREELLATSREASRAWRQQLEAGLGSLPGVLLEDKRFSLALHYRHTPQREAARQELLRRFAGLTPTPRLVAGKEVINLVLPELPHKGDALESFQKSLARPRSLYVGDDVTDEDVFTLQSSEVFKIRVGRSPRSGARHFVPRQRDIRRLLWALVGFLQEEPPAAAGVSGSR